MRAALLLLAACQVSAERAFERDVIPILEGSCAASTCHGVSPGSVAAGDVIDWEQLMFRLDADGAIADRAAARVAALRVVNTLEGPEHSTLLRKATPELFGGLPHYGPDAFTSPDDPRWQKVAAWIRLEQHGGEDPDPLDAWEERFADQVQPELLAMGCATASCHGTQSAVPYRIDPGVAGEVSIAGTRANYDATLRLLAVDSEPGTSRLLRKALPLHDGGIAHKGGNVGFLTGRDDPRAGAIRSWACVERSRRTGADCHQPVRGVVYVRGPLQPGHPLELDHWAPGSDLWFAELDAAGGLVAERNLTASMQPADIRDPAVDAGGEWVVFAARSPADAGHDLWVLNLETGERTRVTDEARALPTGGAVTWRDPTWGPDGRIWAVSTREGLAADRGERLDSDLFAVDPDSGAVERHSWTPHAERHPVFLRSGHEGGELAFTALRDVLAGQERAHPFRFPVGLATEYHQHFGITPPENLFDDMRELADGRYVVTLGDLGGAWGAGQIGVIDRNFGPELVQGEPSLPRYDPPLSRLDPEAGSAGVVARAWRDPIGLPDGRLLAAVADGPLDLSDPTAEPDWGIAVLVLREAMDAGGAEIERWTRLIDTPGVSDTDPQPVYARSAPPEGPWSWDAASPTARLVHQGWSTVDALLGNLEPTGVKRPTGSPVAVRLIEAIPTTLALRQAGDGSHGPARILAEIPLASDDTFQVEVPAGSAVRLQGIDADGIAVGHPHNRWFDFHPGQTIKQGIQPQHFSELCAACHGALDGDPSQVFVDPDVMTTASVTLARYDLGNPRRPIPPPIAGEATRVEVDFTRDVMPILERHCAGCHVGDDPPAGLSLAEADDRAVWTHLMAPGSLSASGMAWVDEPGARSDRSYLVEVLVGRELDAPGVAPLSAHPDTLDASELRTLFRWIDLGASRSGGTP